MENRYLFRGKTINGNWVQGLLAHKNDKWYISNEAGAPFAFETRPESICQCTGYDGIYEKDIFRCDDEMYVIEWSDDSLEWLAESIFSSEAISLGEFSPEQINIIGNEVDNPEMLGE